MRIRFRKWTSRVRPVSTPFFFIQNWHLPSQTGHCEQRHCPEMDDESCRTTREACFVRIWGGIKPRGPSPSSPKTSCLLPQPTAASPSLTAAPPFHHVHSAPETGTRSTTSPALADFGRALHATILPPFHRSHCLASLTV